jgi:hypothetical protein
MPDALYDVDRLRTGGPGVWFTLFSGRRDQCVEVTLLYIFPMPDALYDVDRLRTGGPGVWFTLFSGVHRWPYWRYCHRRMVDGPHIYREEHNNV